MAFEAIEHMAEGERDAAIKDLSAYLGNPAPFTVLVLEATELDQRMKLAKLLAEKTLVVSAELPKDPEERVRMAAMLAAQMARERNSTIDADAAEELADLCNANLAAIRSEIEKLTTYAGAGNPIRRVDVEELGRLREEIFGLGIGGRAWYIAPTASRAFIFLDNLLREGEQPPALVGAMAWMFRKLMEAQDLGPQVSGWQAAGRLGMRANTAEIALRQARKIPRRQLADGLRALYDADSRLKSGSSDDRAVMEFLVARLTGRASGVGLLNVRRYRPPTSRDFRRAWLAVFFSSTPFLGDRAIDGGYRWPQQAAGRFRVARAYGDAQRFHHRTDARAI